MDIERGWRGDASEALVAADIFRNGYGVAYPHGHEQKYDLIIDVGGESIANSNKNRARL